jgi:hypothetical protein
VNAPLKRQLLVVAFGLALAAAWGRSALGPLVLAYIASALLLGVLGAERWLERLPNAAAIALLLGVSLPAGLWLWRTRAALLEFEGLSALPALVAERLRIEALPALAPPLVSADRPQTFFVHAPSHARVRVRLGASARPLPAEELGEGLYRLDYDPRREGPPSPADGALHATIEVDGREVERTLLAVTPLPHPRWLATAPDRTLAATVSEETDELVIVSERGIERRVPVADQPSDCAFVGPRLIAVSHRGDEALWLVDAESGARLRTIVLGSRQVRLAVSADQSRLAVARAGPAPEIVLLDIAAFAIAQRIPRKTAPDWIAFGADAATLVESTRPDARLRRLRLSGSSFQVDRELALGRAAVTLGRGRSGAQIFLATTDYRPDGGVNLGNHFVQDQILTLDVERFRIARSQLTARRSPRQSKPGDVDRGLSPMGIAQGADGSLLVTFAGSDELWRLREDSPEPERIDLGSSELYAPHGIAELASGSLLITSPAAGTLGLLSPRAAHPTLLRLAPDDAFLRSHDLPALERRHGERAFYEATRSGISCQSCHMHADSDEAAHNLGTHEALPTLTVRGLAGTAPYLRDGSFARIGDLDHVAQTLYRGYLRRVPGRAETLEAFVAALARREPEVARDRAREQRGLQAFVRAQCPSCHAFPSFTGLGQQLMRDVFPQRVRPGAHNALLDTPSLLSVGMTAPYLSDGSAASLRAALFQKSAANRHGDTASLKPAERDDLIAFLESL